MGPPFSTGRKKKNIIRSPSFQTIEKTDSLADSFGSERILTDLLKDEKLDQEKLNLCQQKLLDEGFLEDEEIKLILDQLRPGCPHKPKVQEILNKIQIINIRDIDKVIKKHEKGINSVKNKDIVLFFGKTGSGKSTTILYLLGCKMKKIKGEIDANKKPPGIQPNAKFASGTKFLEVVTYKSLKDFLGVNKIKKGGKYMAPPLWLCDTPGFEDTEGIEVETANQMAISRAMKSCSSLKIVALINKSHMGKGEAIEELYKELSKFFNDFEEMLQHIIIHFPDYVQDYELDRLRYHVSEYYQLKVGNEPNKQHFLMFIKKILDTLNAPDFKALNPLDKNPSVFLKKILEMEPLPAERTSKLIQTKMPLKFAEKFPKYLEIKERIIAYLVKDRDYECLDSILEELKILSNYPEMKLYFSKITEIQHNIFDQVRKSIDDACQDLDLLELDQNVLKDNDMEEPDQIDLQIRAFQGFIDKLVVLEKKTQFSDSNIYLRKELLQNCFINKLKELKNRINRLELLDEKALIICRNVEILKKKYKMNPVWFKDFDQCVEKKVSEFERNIETDHLSDEELIREISQRQEDFKQHGNIMQRISLKFQKELNARIKKAVDLSEIKQYFSNPEGINPQIVIGLILDKLKFLELCKENHKLKEFGIDIEKVLKALFEINEGLKGFYDRSYEKLKSHNLVDDAHFDAVFQELSQIEAKLVVMKKFMGQDEDFILKTRYSEIFCELKETMKKLIDFMVFKLGEHFESFHQKFLKGYELMQKFSFEYDEMKFMFDLFNQRIKSKIFEDFMQVQEFYFSKYDQSNLTEFLKVHQRAVLKYGLLDKMAFEENQDIENFDLTSETRKKLFDEIEKIMKNDLKYDKNIDPEEINEYHEFLTLIAKADFTKNPSLKTEAEELLNNLSGHIQGFHGYLKENILKIIESLVNKENDPIMKFGALKQAFAKLKMIEETYPDIIGADKFLEFLLNQLLQALRNDNNVNEKSNALLKYQEFDEFYPKGSKLFHETLKAMLIAP